MAILEDNDILFAHKALNVMAGVTEATRRVAGAIIDHFNKRTGQCDPSIGRLATLLGMDEKTVRRATAILDEKGIITKDSHGGKGHRARYLPNWELFQAIVADWDARMKTGSARRTIRSEAPKTEAAKRTISPGSTGRDCPVKPGEIALQTLRSNQSKKPIEPEQVETLGSEPQTTGLRKPLHGLGRGNKPTAQRSMLLPINGGKGPSHADAARAGAERRLYAEIHALGMKAEADVLEWMTRDRQEATTQAEMQRKGGGLAFILAAMRNARMQAHG